jgi:hypothetical protein
MAGEAYDARNIGPNRKFRLNCTQSMGGQHVMVQAECLGTVD